MQSSCWHGCCESSPASRRRLYYRGAASDGFKLIEVNYFILVLVEKGEHSFEAILDLGFFDSGADDVKELAETDAFSFISESMDEG